MRIMDNPMTPERERECWQASRSGHALAGMVGELLLALSVARNGISHMAGASKQALRERDAAQRELSFLREEYGDTEPEGLTRDALLLQARVLARERDVALAEIKRLCDERDKERDAERADFESLAFDAARVIVAHERGDMDALARAVESLRSNGRHKWWEDV
jgi:hypothetical protein